MKDDENEVNNNILRSLVKYLCETSSSPNDYQLILHIYNILKEEIRPVERVDVVAIILSQCIIHRIGDVYLVDYLYNDIRSVGLSVNQNHLNGIIYVLCHANDLKSIDKYYQLYKYFFKNLDEKVLCSIVLTCLKHHDVNLATSYIEKEGKLSSCAPWNHIIYHYLFVKNEPEIALKCFDDINLVHKLGYNENTFLFFIKYYTGIMDKVKVEHFYTLMKDFHINGNVFSFNYILRIYESLLDIAKLLETYKDMRERNITPNENTKIIFSRIFPPSVVNKLLSKDFKKAV